jgi:hypothetical protein
VVYEKYGESVHRSTAQVLRPREASIKPESLYSGHMGANSSATKWMDRTHYSFIVTEVNIVEQKIKVRTHQVVHVS